LKDVYLRFLDMPDNFRQISKGIRIEDRLVMISFKMLGYEASVG
jgi:hypothetical protein